MAARINAVMNMRLVDGDGDHARPSPAGGPPTPRRDIPRKIRPAESIPRMPFSRLDLEPHRAHTRVSGPASTVEPQLPSGHQCTLHHASGCLATRHVFGEHRLLTVTSLGSGSAGNALLLRTAGTALLVDCGIGVRRLLPALQSFRLTLADVDAVLISHEHSDHIRELPRFLRQDTTVLSTRGSALASKVPPRLWQETRAERPVRLADLEVIAIPVCHDAADPCGFLIRSSAGSVTVVTDLGCSSPAAVEAIGESRLVVLEANHDEALLRRGPYPERLQRRILSNSGHLSNADCAELLARAIRTSTQPPTVWLAHLSETNNRPHLAKQTVQRRLAQVGLRLDLHALPRRETNQTWSPDTAKPGVAQLSFDLPIPAANAGDRKAAVRDRS
jgi:phosphoribosyl 1,2-cyclic phosphodiesterase